MRKAMGENLRDAEPGEDQDAAQRRLNLIRQGFLRKASFLLEPTGIPSRRSPV